MMLDKGKYGHERILSRPSVETVTTDQLTPEQKAVSGNVPGYFDNHGWGFGLSVVTRRDDPSGPIGKYGWDGGLGTSWYSDPSEDMVTVLMTQRAWTSPSPADVCRDFWTSAYQAIDDLDDSANSFEHLDSFVGGAASCRLVSIPLSHMESWRGFPPTLCDPTFHPDFRVMVSEFQLPTS